MQPALRLSICENFRSKIQRLWPTNKPWYNEVKIKIVQSFAEISHRLCFLCFFVTSVYSSFQRRFALMNRFITLIWRTDCVYSFGYQTSHFEVGSLGKALGRVEIITVAVICAVSKRQALAWLLLQFLELKVSFWFFRVHLVARIWNIASTRLPQMRCHYCDKYVGNPRVNNYIL